MTERVYIVRLQGKTHLADLSPRDDRYVPACGQQPAGMPVVPLPAMMRVTCQKCLALTNIRWS